MIRENCLVCASDEGIFLDLEQQSSLRIKADNCKLKKVSESPTSKICHKCAFELEQCNKFIEKIKEASESENPNEPCCILCSDLYNEELFFDLSKQKNGVNNVIEQIQDIFAEELKKKEIEKQFICLSCLYCTNLLTDLRNLSDEISGKLKTIIKNGINPADLPKTKTSIVSRKTTLNQASNLDLNTPSDTDSDSSIMSSRRRNKTHKSLPTKPQQKCNECKIVIKNYEIYRYYQTGKIVCKQCWLTIDPGKTTAKKRKKINYPKTELCSILLKDLYQINDEKEFKIEKNREGKTIFKVIDVSVKDEKRKYKNDTIITNNLNENKESSEDEENKRVKPSKNIRNKGKSKKTTQNVSKSTKSSRRRKVSEGSEDIEKEPITSKKDDDHSGDETIPRKNDKHNSKESDEEDEKLTENKKDADSNHNEEESKIRSNEIQQETDLDQDDEENVIKSVENKLDEDSVKSDDENELKFTGKNRRRLDSEESIQEVKTTRKTRKLSEQINQESLTLESKSSRSRRKRKDSEQSAQESETQLNRSVRTTRKRKESEQSIQEAVESKSTRSTRSKKESNTSELENIESRNTRSSRRRKDSEQSIQENSEIDVDVDSDSGPVSKKAKKSSAKTPKKSPTSNVSNQSTSKRKRGRSSSVESANSFRRSTRNLKKNACDLDEIIEVDNDSDVSKTENENTSENEDIPESKKIRSEKFKTDDGHSDAESNASEAKVRSKRTMSVSSKESIPISTFKTPLEKESQESMNVKYDKNKEISHLDKSKVIKVNDIASSKSIDIETSESEEIDILKSTDEETKDDTSEMENDKRDSPKSITPDDDISKIDSDNGLESKEITDFPENSEVVDSQAAVEIEKSTELDELTGSVEVKSGEKEDLSTENVNYESNEKENNTRKEIIEDENDNDGNVSDSSKRSRATSSRRSSTNSFKTRQSKTFEKKESRKKEKKSDDIVIYDSSDSESIKSVNKSVDKSHNCRICDKLYENKLLGLQHELTHMNRLEIQLQRISVPSNTLNEEHKEFDNSSEKDVSNFKKSKTRTEVEYGEQENNDQENIVNKETIDSDNGETESLNENENMETVETEKNENHNQENEIEENEKVIENDVTKIVDSTENDKEKEISVVEKSRKRSLRKSPVKIEEEKKDRRSRRRRKISIDDESEKEIVAEELVSTKVAEISEETSNGVTEQDEMTHESTETQNVDNENNLELSMDPCESQVNNEDTNDEVEVVPDSPVQSDNDKNSDVIDNLIQDEKSRDVDEMIECETLDNDKFGEEDVECIEATPIIDEDEISKGADAESETATQKDENEVEITEIDADNETVDLTSNLECQKIDLTENDVCEIIRQVDSVEIEEIDPNRNIQEDENTVDSVTEINVAASGEPNQDNNEENPKILTNNTSSNNDEEENTTEDEEALAQQSLEELLQRKGLQVIDEFAESITDGDEESEKEVNVSTEKENCSGKDTTLEIKISDSECTEILEVSNKSINKQKDNAEGVIGECQITQDVDVVEEVINDNELPQNNEVIEDVAVESNVPFDFPLY